MKKTQDNALALPEIILPVINFDLFEQLSFALQNRDKGALEYILSDKLVADDFKDKQDFINKFLSYCKTLEQKHGEIYVQTNSGHCDWKPCQYGKKGIAVSVHSLKRNKQLWNFNLITKFDDTQKISMLKCWCFKVDKANTQFMAYNFRVKPLPTNANGQQQDVTRTNRSR